MELNATQLLIMLLTVWGVTIALLVRHFIR